MIVSCSDGVLDLFDGTAADLDRIAALVARERSAAGVIAAVARLARDTVLPDDVTVIAARREPVPAAPAAA
jgi:sigma-B regulation protein RsbU (phosphoserine phosphatase)